MEGDYRGGDTHSEAISMAQVEMRTTELGQ